MLVNYNYNKYVDSVRGYADLPDGKRNKFFSFKVFDGDHLETVHRLIYSGYIMRAVWFQYLDGTNKKVPVKELNEYSRQRSTI